MSKGISNIQIEKAFRDLDDEDINDSFVGVFSVNHMNRFIDYKTMILEKKGKYLFIITNTDSSEKEGTYWWSIMDIDPKTDLLFFDSFGVDGLKSFIIHDDQKVIEKKVLGTEQLTRTDNKITLVNIKFSLSACKNLSKNFFYFVQSFGGKLKLGDFVNLWVVADRIQDLDSVNCGISQIYYYDNLFNPDKKSKIQNKAKLNKKTIEILLNKLFVLDSQQQNEKVINIYANEQDIVTT